LFDVERPSRLFEFFNKLIHFVTVDLGRLSKFRGLHAASFLPRDLPQESIPEREFRTFRIAFVEG